MPDTEPKPFIDVTEGGSNFKMEDCEFHLGTSNRPVIKTAAKNTQVIRLKVFHRVRQKIKENKWLWAIIVPVAVGMVLLGVEYGLLR